MKLVRYSIADDTDGLGLIRTACEFARTTPAAQSHDHIKIRISIHATEDSETMRQQLMVALAEARSVLDQKIKDLKQPPLEFVEPIIAFSFCRWGP